MLTVGPRIWQETLKILENEICTLQDLDYGVKTEKRGKLDTKTMTWNNSRNLKS